MDICENIVCIVRRCLSEYGLMRNVTLSARVLPCGFTIWHDVEKTARCTYCFLLNREILEKILICILRSDYLDLKAKKLRTAFYNCLRECSDGNRIKGTDLDVFAYWETTRVNEVPVYIDCHHVKTHNVSVPIFYPCALWFLLGTVLRCVPYDSDLEILDSILYVFCRQDKTVWDAKFKYASKIEIDDYLCKARVEKDYFQVMNNSLGRELWQIFHAVSDYLYKTNRILKSGLKKQLNDYLIDVNPEKQMNFDVA